jgi:hypothetical protein
MKKILFLLFFFPFFVFGQWKYKKIEDSFSEKNEQICYIKSSTSSTKKNPTLVIKRIEALDNEKMLQMYKEDPSLPFSQYEVYIEGCYIGNSYSFKYLIKNGDGKYDRKNYLYINYPNIKVIGLDGKNKEACFLNYSSRIKQKNLINSDSFNPFFDQLKKGSSLEIEISSSYGIYRYSFSLSGSSRAINFITSISKSEEKLKNIYKSKIVEGIDLKKDLIAGVCDYQGYYIFTYPSSTIWEKLTSLDNSVGFWFPGAEKEQATGYKIGSAKGGLSSMGYYMYINKILEKMGLIHLRDNPECITGNIKVSYQDSYIRKNTGKRFPGFSRYKGFRLKHNCIPKNNPYYDKSLNLMNIF